MCIQHSDQETKHHLCSGTLSLSVPDFLLPSPDCAENQAFKKIDCACITLFTWRQTTETAYEEAQGKDIPQSLLKLGSEDQHPHGRYNHEQPSGAPALMG